MKTTLKVTLVLALALVASNLFATGNLKLNILPLNEKKAVVSITALSSSALNITITDDKGNIVYYHENEDKNGNYCKIFNFSELEDGTYLMKVVSNDLTTERPLQKNHNDILVGDEKTTLKPFFGVDSNILRCSYMNYAKESTVFHFYSENQEIYTRNIGNDFIVQQALDLSKLKRGDYKAVLTAGNEQFTYNVEIK